VLCRAAYDVTTHNMMAANETLQIPGQQITATILGVGVSASPYVLYQTIWCTLQYGISANIYVRLQSTVIV